MSRNRAGFTFVEMLTVLTLISVLVGIALPKYRMVRDRAIAAQAVEALNLVRQAAYAYYESHGQWPDEAPTGTVPSSLISNLPAGFQFDRGPYRLGWRVGSWVTEAGPASLHMGEIATDDAVICDVIAGTLGYPTNPDLMPLCGGSSSSVYLLVEN